MKFTRTDGTAHAWPPFDVSPSGVYTASTPSQVETARGFVAAGLVTIVDDVEQGGADDVENPPEYPPKKAPKKAPKTIQKEKT